MSHWFDDLFVHLQRASGVVAPRPTPEQIEQLKVIGYKVESTDVMGTIVWQWFYDAVGEFQDDEPSYSEEDCWAAAFQNAREYSPPLI